MVLLSPLPCGHLNHCQIQQTGLWNSSTYSHVSLLTGHIRGGCTKAWGEEVQLLHSHCPASAMALLHGGTCSIHSVGQSRCQAWHPAAAGSQTPTQPGWRCFILASCFSLFSFRELSTPVPSCGRSQAPSAAELMVGSTPQTPSQRATS